jgi:hypothetical protein
MTPASGSIGGYAEDVVHASTARTTSGNTALIDGYQGANTLRAQLNVTAASGTTPTLDIVIEDTLDGTNYNTIITFAQKVTTAREVVNVTVPFAGRIRVRWTIAGTTPSFTFDVIVASQSPLT